MIVKCDFCGKFIKRGMKGTLSHASVCKSFIKKITKSIKNVNEYTERLFTRGK